MIAELLVLRLVHVLGGILWLGSGLSTRFFLAPALAQAGPASGPVMEALRQRRLVAATLAAAPEAERAARAAEVDRLRRRGGRASAAAMVLLIAAVGMAIARYLV